MAVGLCMQFKGAKTAKYDAIMKEMGLSDSSAKWPDGIISHVAGSTADGMCVVDVWRSQADFDRFFASRLKPAFDKIGGMPEPQVTKFEVHNSHKHG